VIYFHALGHSIVVLNNAYVAYDLLEKRSAIYSDRPRLVLFKEVSVPVWLSLRCYLTSISLGIYPSLPLMEYGKRFQKHRKLFHSVLSRIEVGKFEEPLVEEARFLAKSIIEKPASYNWLVRRSASCLTSWTMKTNLSCCLKICDSLSHGCRVRSPNSVRRR